MQFNTQVIHGGQQIDPLTGAVNTPIYQTTTYQQKQLGGQTPWEYARGENPTRATLERLIAELEHGQAGFAFASGMAAIHNTLSMLSAGDHILLGDDVYGGTFRLVNSILSRLGLTFSQVDMADLAAVRAAMTPKTKVILLETPTNPLLKIADIQAIAAIAQQHDALLVVDNTFASPYNQTPLDLGADIVVHSGTKYLGGHSDVLSGFVVVNDANLAAQQKHLQMSIGAVQQPHDSYLLLRSIKTLALRMQAHNQNAMTIAQFLANHDQVARVYYPGLAADAGHAVAAKQMRGFGGMVSLALKPGSNVKQFVESLQVFTLAESLGGVESLIEVPAVMTHASIPADIRQANGITDELVRISVGIEAIDDLLADLQQSFNQL